MNSTEEIKKLKALLIQGAITENEYTTLIQKLDPEKNEKEENDKNEIITNPPIESDPELIIISNLNRLPENVVTAGKSIQSAIGFQVASYICNVIGIVIFILSLSSLLSGRGFGDLLGDNPAFIFALIFISIGFVFWIVSLTKFNKAGEFLKKSEAVYYGRNIIKVEPSRQKVESHGLKVGQAFAGGIIAYFDETGNYVAIVSKADLTEKMNLKQARLACKKFNSDGYSDWFLPDGDELVRAYNNLHNKQTDSFKKETYWVNRHGVDYSNLYDFSSKQDYFRQKPEFNLVRPMRLVKLL